MAGRSNLVVVDGADTYRFALALGAGEEGHGYSLQTRAWEPGDSLDRWRIPLHGWEFGLSRDRLKSDKVYAKGNCDGSQAGLLLFPPLVNSLTLTNAVNPSQGIEFDSKVYVNGGRYIYTIDSSYAVVEDKDFGAGKACTAMAVFGNELVCAMGESEKIWKRSTSTWAQASDATYATALGVVDSKLWRSHDSNQIDNATTAPLTLASWTPADPNEYTAGDTTFATNGIRDFGGVPFVLRPDGVFAPDGSGKFHNQAPQLRIWPHTDNGKGAFVAWGALWVPTAAGLLRIRQGESKVFGPELSGRPGYRFWVRGGVEIGGAVYLLCTDEAASANTFICKMTKAPSALIGATGQEYIYHEWCRLGATTKGYFITATTKPTNPTLIVGFGNNVRYIKLGRGGGVDTDDANYDFGTAMECETGVMMPAKDMSVVSTFVGVSVLLDYSAAGETLSLSYSMDGAAYVDLLSTQDGGGVAPISLTDGYESVTRYAPPGTQGQFLEVKFTGALTSAAGTNRPEIREAWAFGYSHPKVTDVVTLSVLASATAQVNGVRTGLSRAGVLRLWRRWQDAGAEIEVELPGYEQERRTRFVVAGVEDVEVETVAGPGGKRDEITSQVKVQLVRVDRAGRYAAA